MLDPQNFSMYAGDDFNITVDIDPDDEVTLVGAVITWSAYEQEFGQPVAGADPVITKNNGVNGTIVVIDPELQRLKVPLEYADTVGLLRNYYHETTVEDPTLGRITVANGFVTILGTENRSA